MGGMKESLGAKTVVFPTPVLVVGSYGQLGEPNAMTCSCAGICCSQPPCLSIALRKATLTYDNIVARQAFTVSIPPESCVRQTDLLGLASGRAGDKFATAGLTPVKSELVDAPYVKEFPLVAECKVVHSLDLGLHTLFVGEILDVKADPSVLSGTQLVDVEKLRPLVYSSELQGYYRLGGFVGPAFSIGKP
jgi:flavin reductase (DIM6/NTAB) family NADH-FMN oxidoreductase RutF